MGFALSCYPVAVKNGWMSRTAAAAQTLKTLQSFWSSTQSDQPDATGYKGFYYHFLDMKTRRRVWQCELSLVDTTLLLAGVLMAGCYFDGGGEEAEIRDLADALYRRVDWQWAQNNGGTVAQGWKPECGFLHYGWEGYNEATILYILGLGSPTFPLPPTSFTDWTVTYQLENLLGQNVLYSGPLFTHLFSHAWIDFRGIQDKFMRRRAERLLREHPEFDRAPSRVCRPQSPRLRRIWPELLGYHRRRRSGKRRAARGPSRPPLLRLHRARRALRTG